MARISNPQGYGDSRPSSSSASNHAGESGPPAGPMVGSSMGNIGGDMGIRPDCGAGGNHAPVKANVSLSE